MRYIVSHNPWGFESDVGVARLTYAITDTEPDKVPVYIAREHERVLKTPIEAQHYFCRPVELLTWRHISFATTKEDAETIAKALNGGTL